MRNDRVSTVFDNFTYFWELYYPEHFFTKRTLSRWVAMSFADTISLFLSTYCVHYEKRESSLLSVVPFFLICKIQFFEETVLALEH